MWEEFFRECNVQTTSGTKGYRKVTPPTADLLDAFEAAHKCILPSSYREFVSLFAAGELAGYYRIWAPFDGDDSRDLSQGNRESQEDLDFMAGNAGVTADSIRHFIFFAENAGGDCYAWDTHLVTDPGQHEYAIIRLWRHGELEQVASTFPQFIFDHCLKPDPAKKWFPEKTYARFGVPI